jgi:Cu-processing system ATP-binding protein
MTLILRTNAVSKQFKTVRALDNVSLSVAAGERVALLGHNGAGKTTLFRMILGFTKPSEGDILVCGQKPGSKIARQSISYLPESVMFPKSLTGREIICFYARLKGIAKKDALSCLARVGLEDASNRKSGTYSNGMRQRLGLAQALAGNPKFLLLDEPTNGLDPFSRRDFYTLIDEAAAAGTAVLLSSHSLSEVEAKTDRIAILKNGALVADATLSQLQIDAAVPLRIRVKARPESIDKVRQQLGGRKVNGQSVEFSCSLPDKMIRLQDINALGSMVTDIDVSKPSLDDVYSFYSSKHAEDHDHG